jgi:hypothetical protein
MRRINHVNMEFEAAGKQVGETGEFTLRGQSQGFITADVHVNWQICDSQSFTIGNGAGIDRTAASSEESETDMSIDVEYEKIGKRVRLTNKKTDFRNFYDISKCTTCGEPMWRMLDNDNQDVTHRFEVIKRHGGEHLLFKTDVNPGNFNGYLQFYYDEKRSMCSFMDPV